MEDTKVKHTNITTIHNDNENGKYLQKSVKIPNWQAWMERLSGIIKSERKCKHF
jgi:hypothetical protein